MDACNTFGFSNRTIELFNCFRLSSEKQMSTTSEPLSRTTSGESSRSQSSIKLLSRSPSNRKGHYADTEATTGDVGRASVSMPPLAIKPNLRYQSMSPPSSRILEASGASASGAQLEDTMLLPPSLHASGIPSRHSDELSTSALSVSSATAQDPTAMRKSDPEIDARRMSFSSLYGFGKSAPGSVAGGSDQDGVPARSTPVFDQTDSEAAQRDSSDKATTATQALSVTALSQNGALSPSLSTSLKEGPLPQPTVPTNTNSTSPMSPTAPNPYTLKEGRTVRGRPAVASRRVSQSNPNSASASAERSSGSDKNPNRIGTIGICALDSKARSKPSRNILNRLVGKDNDFDVIIFGDKVILDESVENWPVCDFLISFFSEGFPLHKAIAYAKLRRPYCVNDLPMQTVLWDRRLCLMILDHLGVQTPPRLTITRDGGPVILSPDIVQRMYQLTGLKLEGEDGRGGGLPPPEDIHMEDDNDTLVVNGKRLSKPFVEKPVSGEDHNINIYYPKSQGGGGRRLFRKVNNKSSEKDANLVIPKAITESEASYVYEQFLKVENAEDVKAYTVGPDFCHAETRKSPVVDGVVKRNPNGKEVRYITALSKEEQIMASKIALGFGQRICGFDLLRVGGESYVIDVNGWSFVKDNNEYYDKCASILKSMFIREKLRWEGATTPSESDEKELSLPVKSAPDLTAGHRKPTFGKDQERGSHRNALKSVFRTRSISQLREHVSNAAHKMGHPQSSRMASGSTTPIMSTPSLERTPSAQKKVQTIPASHEDSLPPPALPKDVAAASAKNGDQKDHATYADRFTSEPAIDVPSTLPAPASKSQWKLKGMVAVIRHADRTPKQKFKFTFHTKPFVDLLKGHQEEVLLVGEGALHSVQAAVRQALQEGVEDSTKLRILQNALAKKGAWPGTKVQIKPMFKAPKDKNKDGKDNDKNKEGKDKDKKGKAKEEVDPSDTVPIAGPVEEEDIEKWKKQVNSEPKSLPDSDTGGPAQVHAQTRSDSLSDVTMSRHAAADNNLVVDKLQLVMKWGGEPTHSARYQAADLGENMRNDFLLMNREVLSDVSIFSSSERRVKTSAQIFAGGFLDQEDVRDDQIRVRKDLLDDSNAAKDEMDKVKKKLKGLLRQGNQPPEQFAWPKNTPEPYVVVRNVVELMKFHRRVMRSNFSKLQTSDAVTALEKIKNPSIGGSESDSSAMATGPAPATNTASSVQARWCTGEDAELFKERWEKLFNEFTDAEKVDPSKISELYDTMKFDALHNRQFLEWVFTPSESQLLEEDGEGQRLTRTESVVAREEFAHTHDGIEPTADAKGDHEVRKYDAPPRSDTSSTAASGVVGPAERERHSLSHRMGFRRRSADLMAVARNAMAVTNAENSYFNLYRGSVSAMDSKVRNDERLEKLNELYGLSKILFDFIGPQEYGITDAEKLEIGLLTSLPLLREIVKDLEEVQASDDAKSFIYFTKESHIYTLLNCILEGGVQTKIARNAIPELDYLSQICFELYESENAEADIDPSNPDSNFNYSIRIAISPGCHTFDPLDVQLDSKHCIGCAPRRTLTPHGNWKEVLETLRAKFHTVKLPKSFTVVNLSEKIPQAFDEDSGVNGLEDGRDDASPVGPVQ